MLATIWEAVENKRYFLNLNHEGNGRQPRQDLSRCYHDVSSAPNSK